MYQINWTEVTQFTKVPLGLFNISIFFLLKQHKLELFE